MENQDKVKNRNSIIKGFGLLLISAIFSFSEDYLIIYTNVGYLGLLINFLVVSITLIAGLILISRGFIRIALAHEKIKGLVTGLVIVVATTITIWFLWESGISISL